MSDRSMKRKHPYPRLADKAEPDIGEGTVFDWRHHRKRTLRFGLSTFLLCSIMAHAIGFYLFQVVYPEPSRVVVQTPKVMFLDPKNPEIRSLLRRYGDRAAFMQRPSDEAALLPEISDLELTYISQVAKPEQSFFDLSDLLIPPALEVPQVVSKPTAKTSDSERVSRLSLVKEGEEPAVAPWSRLDRFPLPGGIAEISAYLEVDADGRCQVSEIVSPSDVSDVERQEVVELVKTFLRLTAGEGRVLMTWRAEDGE